MRIRLRLLLPVLLCVLAPAVAPALPKAAVPGPVTWENPLLEKTFPLLAALESDPAANAVLAAHPALGALARVKFRALSPSAAAPAPGKSAAAQKLDALAAQLAALLWSDAEIRQVADTLRTLLAENPAIRAVVRDTLRPSGLFRLHEKLPDADFLAHAWSDAAGAVNRVIKTYALGVPPRYPQIDALAYDPASDHHIGNTLAHLAFVRDDPDAAGLFFQPALRLALMLLRAHQRDYAARFEPLHEGENRAAFVRAARLDWTRHRHAALLVLGHGPQLSGVPLSPVGRAMLDAAVRRFREGDSAYLILSGGCVWPSGTAYCEAVEMKRVVVRDLGVPEECVVVDPHARHTTTNLRNAARLLLRLGAPPEKSIRVFSAPWHIAYALKPRFQKRCETELGYSPFTVISRPGPFEFVCALSPLCVTAGPDPLDP